MKKRLITYAKKPLAGYAKTRLGSKIGYEESAGVYARLLYKTLFEINKLDKDELSVEVSVASKEDSPFFKKAFPEFVVSIQKGLDLGERFSNSFSNAFKDGADVVIVIGTDIPDLESVTINAAYSALEEKDVVIGPDRDGGYYLIGTRVKNANLFQEINWSSENVFTQTITLLESQNLSIEYLNILSDIDTYEDYLLWLDQSH
jgi:rSAM/selenodomain-associated transferase 1